MPRPHCPILYPGAPDLRAGGFMLECCLLEPPGAHLCLWGDKVSPLCHTSGLSSFLPGTMASGTVRVTRGLSEGRPQHRVGGAAADLGTCWGAGPDSASACNSRVSSVPMLERAWVGQPGCVLLWAGRKSEGVPRPGGARCMAAAPSDPLPPTAPPTDLPSPPQVGLRRSHQRPSKLAFKASPVPGAEQTASRQGESGA